MLQTFGCFFALFQIQDCPSKVRNSHIRFLPTFIVCPSVQCSEDQTQLLRHPFLGNLSNAFVSGSVILILYCLRLIERRNTGAQNCCSEFVSMCFHVTQSVQNGSWSNNRMCTNFCFCSRFLYRIFCQHSLRSLILDQLRLNRIEQFLQLQSSIFSTFQNKLL